MPEDMPDRTPDRMSEDIPEDVPDRVPEDMPEDMPDRMPADIPNKMPEDMSDRMPEDLPVTKRIDVTVGITRSKVIYMTFFHEQNCCLWLDSTHAGVFHGMKHGVASSPLPLHIFPQVIREISPCRASPSSQRNRRALALPRGPGTKDPGSEEAVQP